MKKKINAIFLIGILVLFSCIALYLFIPKNRSGDIDKYLMNKYTLSKNQYSLISIEKDNTADTYFYQDLDGNLFEVKDYGSPIYSDLMDNYQKINFDNDIKNLFEKYFGSDFVYANNDYNFWGGINQKIYKRETFEFAKNMPLRIWVKSNDKNKEEILNLSKKNIDIIYEELKSNVRIYIIKDFISNQAYIDFNEHGDNIENSGDFSNNYYYVVHNYKNEMYDNKFVHDAATGNRYYFSGELME